MNPFRTRTPEPAPEPVDDQKRRADLLELHSIRVVTKADRALADWASRGRQPTDAVALADALLEVRSLATRGLAAS